MEHALALAVSHGEELGERLVALIRDPRVRGQAREARRQDRALQASARRHAARTPPGARPRVLLFSGHMIDAPDRPAPRFPPALEPAVGRAIADEVASLSAGPGDVAVSSAACGGDILFAESVLQHGVQTRLYLPFDEPTFLDKSVSFADDRWTDRYHAVVARSRRFCAPEVLGPLSPGADPYERVNLWMLDEARRLGRGGLVFICVWDGEGGDGRGGTKHMMDAVRAQRGGQVVWIDIRRL